MSEIATLVVVLAAGLIAYGQARRRGEWSWAAFGWTLLLVLIYAGATVWAGIALDSWLDASDPLVRTLCRVAPIAIGVVPLAIGAKAIQRHYARRQPPPSG